MIAIFPKLAECAMSGDIERLACLVREHYGDEQTFKPRLNIPALCRRIGIDMKAMGMEHHGALMVRDEKGHFDAAIAISDRLPPAEFAFTVAHLLGHFFLHVQLKVVRGDWAGNGFKELLDPMQRYAQELDVVQQGEDRETDEEADAFAAALLMPSGMVKRAWARLQDKEKMAQFFGVSPLVLQRRLEVLGLMQSRAPGNFLAAEAKLKKPAAKTQAKSTKPRAAAPEVDKPDNIANVNKMMAHSSYRPQAEKEPKKTATKAAKKVAAKPAEETKAAAKEKASTKKGMARIRELAKQIDSSVE